MALCLLLSLSGLASFVLGPPDDVRMMLIRCHEFRARMECPKVPTHMASFPKGATQDSMWEDKQLSKEWGVPEALLFL